MPHDPIDPPPTSTDPSEVPDATPPPHHHPDHIDTLYGTDPLSYIATPPILIEDLFATPETSSSTPDPADPDSGDAIPDPEPAPPSLPAPDPAVYKPGTGRS